MATRRRIKVTANLSIKRPTKFSTDGIKIEDVQPNIKIEKPDVPKSTAVSDVLKQKPSEIAQTPIKKESIKVNVKEHEFKAPLPKEVVNVEKTTPSAVNAQLLSSVKRDTNEQSFSPKKSEQSTAVISTNTARKRVRTESTTSNNQETISTSTKVRKTSVRVSDDQQQSNQQSNRRRRYNNVPNPDKQSMRMYDMIYYNPSTNPIKPKAPSLSKQNSVENLSAPPTPPAPPTNEETQQQKKENSKLPTPQIKLGPNGEMILDEQSLIIENEKEKEIRETIAQGEIIYDDDITGNSGYYRRYKRTRDWPNDETIRFYKCLHTIGTDFSMMLQLFPNRTRRDLKLKFKKEEKINLALVNKALLQPRDFNIDELKKELDDEEEEMKKQKELQSEKRLSLIELMKEQRKEKHKQLKAMKCKNPKKQLSKSDRIMLGGDFIEKNEKYCNAKSKRKRNVKKKKVLQLLSDDEDDIENEILPDAKPDAENSTVKESEIHNLNNADYEELEEGEFLLDEEPNSANNINIIVSTSQLANNNEYSHNNATIAVADNSYVDNCEIVQEYIEQNQCKVLENVTESEDDMPAEDDCKDKKRKFNLISYAEKITDDEEVDEILLELDGENNSELDQAKTITELKPTQPETSNYYSQDFILPKIKVEKNYETTSVIKRNDQIKCIESKQQVPLQNSRLPTPPPPPQDPNPESEPEDEEQEEYDEEVDDNEELQHSENSHQIPITDNGSVSNEQEETEQQDGENNDNTDQLALLQNIDINSLVLVESQDMRNPEKTIYEIYIMSPETGKLSEKPLDVPEHIVESIRSIIEAGDDDEEN
uniref:Putative neuroproteinsis n=1 Tax=Corethrella appendiculata TaxID=1370023 RepID=U5EM50_9DIPT